MDLPSGLQRGELEDCGEVVNCQGGRLPSVAVIQIDELRRFACAHQLHAAPVLRPIDSGDDIGDQFPVRRDVRIADELKREVIFSRYSAGCLGERHTDRANHQAENENRFADCVHFVLRIQD